MSKKVSRIIGAVMLVCAAAFFLFALNHPEGSFPWSNGVTFAIYGVYLVVMIVMFIAPFRKK